jgi:hypothetical protein
MFATRWRIGLCLVLAIWGAIAATAPGYALDVEPFTEGRFRELQAQNAIILVDVAADWCPTCSRQKAVISRYVAQRPHVALTVLEVDFDRQKSWVTRLEAPMQSTLILYRGKLRTWFSVGETDDDVIFAAIDEAAAAL